MEKTVLDMQTYYDKTHIPERVKLRYCMYLSDLRALYDNSQFNVYETLYMAFNYGMAKGYRAAKAESARKGGSA